ncbi:MAG: hypothetical protein KJ955_07905 [Nanoarchaeota archaeon]|nr:hypothetical protein [Nanoarchaeota archaeon]
MQKEEKLTLEDCFNKVGRCGRELVCRVKMFPVTYARPRSPDPHSDRYELPNVNLQSGFINMAERTLYGAQIAGFCNGLDTISEDDKAYGLQLSGFMNIAFTGNGMCGAQIAGFINGATNFKGLQVGAVNVAGPATGLQVGGLNLVVEADGVLQIGGLCIIASNPLYSRILPFINYACTKEKRQRKKQMNEESLKKEIEELRKETLGVRI